MTATVSHLLIKRLFQLARFSAGTQIADMPCHFHPTQVRTDGVYSIEYLTPFLKISLSHNHAL